MARVSLAGKPFPCSLLSSWGKVDTGGVIYGHAVHSDTVATREKTDAICSHVTTRLLNTARV